MGGLSQNATSASNLRQGKLLSQAPDFVMPEQSEIERQFGKTLLVVAHPDDEVIGCGLLLQRLPQATIAFMTDGAPADRYFWGKFGSRTAYAEVRAKETARALGHLKRAKIMRFGVRDQGLMFHLQAALEWLGKIVAAERPQTIVTHAYEGGHPDHDCCSFLSSLLAAEYRVQVREIPLYSREGGKLVRQHVPNGSKATCISASDEEAQRKLEMVRAYRSQEEFLQSFNLSTERYLCEPRHDYARRPHAGKLNYECWGWEIAGSDLCKAFAQVTEKFKKQRAKSA
jgi:LmbE family N-acetylglucosaminyl deacetylase